MVVSPTGWASRVTRRVRAGHVPLWSASGERWSLSAQVLALVAVMLLLVLVPVEILSWESTQEEARAEAVARAQAAAATLADSPWVIAAASAPDPTALLASTVEQVRVANGLLFIVVMDTSGTRWTHPDPTQIGRTYVGDIAAAAAGGAVVEEFSGTLGRSVRVVVPVRDGGRVVALVSAGVSMDTVHAVGLQRGLQLAAIGAASLALGAFGTWLIARRVRRQTRGLGPRGLDRLHSYYEALLHSVRAGLVLVNRDGSVVVCNDEAAQLLGTDAGTGRAVDEWGLDRDLTELMASGRACAGETYAVAGRALVVTQAPAVLDGQELGWVTTLLDRTDLVRLTGELDTLRSFSEMLRSRAHEADNRLHTVIMLVELGRPHQAVEFATSTIEQSQALVDAVTSAVTDAPLAALLLGKSAQADERGVALRLADDLTVPNTGLASSDLLVVLGNLIDNAIDAAVASPEPRWVRLGGASESSNGRDWIVFEVSDSGAGIPPDRLADAFRRGYSTKQTASDRPQGRGLGLALVNGTVRRLGGTLEVSGDPTRFVVRLPVPRRGEGEA
jgi:two-component system, CitB family, sensor kinase